MMKSKRLRIATIFSTALIIVGIIGYIYEPEYIADLGIYFGSVLLPILFYIFGETYRKSDNIINEDIDEP